MRALASCYSVIDEWADGAADALASSGRRFLLLYNVLSVQALADDPRGILWRMTPKFHGFIHLCEAGSNPRSTWNYSEESEIGDCARIAEGCHPAKLPARVIEKHRLLGYSG